MMSILKCLFVAAFGAQYALGLPALETAAASTCAAATYTTIITETYTILSTSTRVATDTIPHSCPLRTVATPSSACPTYACPPIIADCIVQTTTTITIPPIDPCCPTTSTTTVPGPCSTCQSGCSTHTFTTTVYGADPFATLAARGMSTLPTPIPTCTTTLLVGNPLTFGPTKTVYPYSVTETFSADCDGCALVTRNINGIGPAVYFTTTVTEKEPMTVTTHVCSV